MRIVVVKLSAIGDVVHALPAVAALRRALPEAHLTWVAERRAAAILVDCPVIDELVEIDTRSWRKRMLAPATMKEIRKSAYRMRSDRDVDIAIDFQGLVKSGLVVQATRARRRLGFETCDLREPLSRRFLNEQVATAAYGHVIEKNMALANAAAGAPMPLRPAGALTYEFPIALNPDDLGFAEHAAAFAEWKFAILNPGGGWRTKLWPAARFGELADYLYEQHGLRSYVTFGPGEEPLAQSVAAASRSEAARPIASTLKQFVALARQASLFVGGDTGPLHLAAAAGTPIVGLYGPTSPARNGPFHESDVSVGRDLWCRGECHRRSCWHWECLEIPVDEVARAVARRLGYPSTRVESEATLVRLERL